MKKKDRCKYYTYGLDMILLNVLAIVLFVILSLGVYLIERNDNYIITLNSGLLIMLMFLWLVIHEVLHGIGFSLFKEVDKKNITFGAYLEKGVFYCMCKQNISKKVILTSLLFPVSIIGIFTLIIGMVFNFYELVFLSILNIVSSIGDIVMTSYFLKCPNDIIYLDLDDCTSFTVLSTDDLSNISTLGVKLLKSGDYNPDSMVSTDKRRLVISKWSYIFLVFIFILFIVMFVAS